MPQKKGATKEKTIVIEEATETQPIPVNTNLMIASPPPSTEPVFIEERALPEVSLNKEQTNANEFYLYAELFEKSKNKSRLDSVEIDELLKSIKLLDTEGHGFLYVIIRMYSLKTGTAKLFDQPYSAKKVKEYNQVQDIEFDLKNIPNTLQRMLLCFCRMHLDNMKINQARHHAIKW